MWREMEDLLSLDDGSLKVRSSGTSWGREVCPLMCGSPEGEGIPPAVEGGGERALAGGEGQ